MVTAMYIGIDHGTTAIRFATAENEFKVSRVNARDFVVTDLSRLCPLDEITGIALTYSMGDNFSAIQPIQTLKNRGIVSREGAGEHTGGGTRVFDEIYTSGIPTVAIPGLHRGSPTDPRFKVYSHQASPEKIGIAYEVVSVVGDDAVVCDVSSNTVTILVREGRIIGALDACIFAPGRVHGALDLEAIRRIDLSQETANEAFLHAGVQDGVSEDLRLQTIALFVAMECAAMQILAPGAPIALCGSLSALIASEVTSLLHQDLVIFDEWTAARGLARIAESVFSGADSILGLSVIL